jgi:Flp pilus assembly protein protease CpaA
MILTLFTITALIAVTIGSYTDIKTLEVPDWLNYSLIAVGLGGNLLFSIAKSDYIYILNSLLGLGIALLLGFMMYYTGQWGGGDSKMLFGLGAVLGLDINIIRSFHLDFLSKFMINMLFAGALYGILWIIFMGIKNRKEVYKKIKKSFADKRFKIFRIVSGLLSIIGLGVIYFFPIYMDPRFKIIFTSLIILFFLMNYLLVIVKAIEEASMIRMVEISKLTEGDWIVDDIVVDGEKITGPKDLGIEKKQIARLLELSKIGKIKKVKVKYGIPFVPSFFLGLVYTIITNSIFVMLFI